MATKTRSTGTASTSAAICAITVRAPWPISTVLASTVTLASGWRRTMASDRAPGRRVGVAGFRVEDDVGHPVRSRGRVRAFLDDARPDVGIGAHVEIGATLGGPQPPVALEAEPHPGAGVAASDRPEGLLHREGEPDGPPDHARERPHDGLELGVGLAAEAAAEGRHDDADAAHGHAEHLGQLHAHGVWVLRRGPHGQGALF